MEILSKGLTRYDSTSNAEKCRGNGRTPFQACAAGTLLMPTQFFESRSAPAGRVIGWPSLWLLSLGHARESDPRRRREKRSSSRSRLCDRKIKDYKLNWREKTPSQSVTFISHHGMRKLMMYACSFQFIRQHHPFTTKLF